VATKDSTKRSGAYLRSIAGMGGAMTAAIVSLSLGVPAAGAAWEPRDFESPTGDRAQGIAEPAAGGVPFVLIVGCDGERGDRWRGVTVVQPPTAATALRLEEPKPGPRPRQRVRVSIGSAAPIDDTFEIGRPPTGARLYWVPQASPFVADMLAAEKASASSQVRVEFRLADGKPIAAEFPLAGFGAAFATLAKRCHDWQVTPSAAKAG
jgi:hypothetical protein